MVDCGKIRYVQKDNTAYKKVVFIAKRIHKFVETTSVIDVGVQIVQ